MSGCPFHTPATPVRDGLPALTRRIASLPVDDRGYPIPYFVDYVDGKPDFRLFDGKKWRQCHNERLCFTCGQKLGKFVTFPIGAMCAVNRTFGEPPSHLECCEWSVVGCPHLSNPKAKRREDEITRAGVENAPGLPIVRNAGVTCLWTCKGYSIKGKLHRGYEIFRDPKNRPLIQLGNPEIVAWWSEGRQATRAEVQEAIRTGLPLLEAACELETLAETRDLAHTELLAAVQRLLPFLPAAPETSIILP